LSKMTAFLVFQIIQHAVMGISLNMELPKSLLAVIIISRGSRERDPVYGNTVSTVLAKWALKEKVKTRFFKVGAAESTGVIVEMHVLPS
jgi:hypothetical protein